MLIPVYLAQIKGGNLTLQNKSGFLSYLKQLKDGTYEVVVRRKISTRSLQQNAYLWGVVYQLISDHTGMTPEEVHDFCKLKFLRKQVGKYTTLGSTARLNKSDFGQYVEKIKMFAAQELSVVIPEPNIVEVV